MKIVKATSLKLVVIHLSILRFSPVPTAARSDSRFCSQQQDRYKERIINQNFIKLFYTLSLFSPVIEFFPIDDVKELCFFPDVAEMRI